MEPIEAQAMAWSYAACCQLEIDPAIVFHVGGWIQRSCGEAAAQLQVGSLSGIERIAGGRHGRYPRDGANRSAALSASAEMDQRLAGCWLNRLLTQ